MLTVDYVLSPPKIYKHKEVTKIFGNKLCHVTAAVTNIFCSHLVVHTCLCIFSLLPFCLSLNIITRTLMVALNFLFFGWSDSFIGFESWMLDKWQQFLTVKHWGHICSMNYFECPWSVSQMSSVTRFILHIAIASLLLPWHIWLFVPQHHLFYTISLHYQLSGSL